MKISLGLTVGLVLLAGCDADTGDAGTMPTRPVTVIELIERYYARERERTGVVSLYREEKIGFEIGGRVTTVLDEGLEVRGPVFNEQGELIRRGDPIAAMEGTRYLSQAGVLRAQLETARRDLQAVGARVTLARQTLDRRSELLADGFSTQQAADDAQSAFDQAVAQREARRAAVRAAEQQLESADEDLGDAVLHAPFSGRITAVHIKSVMVGRQ